MKYTKTTIEKTDSFSNTELQKKFIFPKDQYTQIKQAGSLTIKTLANRGTVLVSEDFE